MFEKNGSRLRVQGTFCLAALLVFTSLSCTAMANALESDLVLMPVQSFTGTVDSIPVGGGNFTGPITLSLDSTATNSFGLDKNLEQGKIDVTLLLTSPLFSALGETPRIHIMETGHASVEYVEDP